MIKLFCTPWENAIYNRKNGQRKATLLLLMAFISSVISGQETGYELYPAKYDSMPEISSPSWYNDTTEIIVILVKNDKYALAPVTVENGMPLLYSYKVGTLMGKDQQLLIDKGDFPELARSGLHSEEELENKELITGFPISVINCTGRPNAYSLAGFFAEDENIISVLKNDNETVRILGLTHRQLARPLFHVWNLILKEYELGNFGRFYDNVTQILYNKHLLNFQASGSKGWQISIFFDEIQGRHNIHIDRKLTTEEEKYLDKNYSYLSPEKMNTLKRQLTNLDFSEMLPYYIMRYGFYEGHTEYRTDPVSIMFIFGLRNIFEIDRKLEGHLFEYYMDHFISE